MSTMTIKGITILKRPQSNITKEEIKRIEAKVQENYKVNSSQEIKLTVNDCDVLIVKENGNDVKRENKPNIHQMEGISNDRESQKCISKLNPHNEIDKMNGNEPDGLNERLVNLSLESKGSSKQIKILARPQSSKAEKTTPSNIIVNFGDVDSKIERTDVFETTLVTINSKEVPSVANIQQVIPIRDLLEDKETTKSISIPTRSESLGKADPSVDEPDCLSIEKEEPKESSESIRDEDNGENPQKGAKEEETLQNVTILKRPEGSNHRLAENRSEQLIKTLEQRQREYDEARLRIFGATETDCKSCGGNESNTVSNDENKQSNNAEVTGRVIESHEANMSVHVEPVEETSSPVDDFIESPYIDEFNPDFPEFCPEKQGDDMETYEVPSQDEHRETLPETYDDYFEQAGSSEVYSHGYQHPLHYYNQPVPNFRRFYNNDMEYTNLYYCSHYDIPNFGPFVNGVPNFDIPLGSELTPDFTPNFGMYADMFYPNFSSYNFSTPNFNGFPGYLNFDDFARFYDLSLTDFDGSFSDFVEAPDPDLVIYDSTSDHDYGDGITMSDVTVYQNSSGYLDANMTENEVRS